MPACIITEPIAYTTMRLRNRLAIDTVAPTHKPHKRQQYAEQMHADIAGLGEQELRATTTPHRAFIDVLPVHEVREIAGQRLDMQMDG